MLALSLFYQFDLLRLSLLTIPACEFEYNIEFSAPSQQKMDSEARVAQVLWQCVSGDPTSAYQAIQALSTIPSFHAILVVRAVVMW